jgi:L-ascorbate metabolism protein UlaG (beta-lactamase superfamily)
MERTTMPTLQYIGHSAFVLEGEGNTVVIDPFITGNPMATISADDVHPTTILITHAHNDHVGDAVELSKRTGAPIICTFELANFLASKGAETIGANHGGTVQFAGGSVKITPAWHTSSYEDGDSVVAPGIPAGMIVTFGDKKIYFAGDTCLFLDMQLIGEVGLDVAVLPIGDHFTMGPEDGVRAAKFLRPKVVVPCHYDTFPPIKQDIGEFKKALEDQTSAKAVCLKPGETWEIVEASIEGTDG